MASPAVQRSIRVGSVVVTVAVLVAAATIGRRPSAQRWLVDGTFWSLALALLLLVTTAVAPLRCAGRADWRWLGAVAAGALATTTLVFIVVPPAFRVLADETNLVSTSLSFYLDRSFGNIVELIRSPTGPEILTRGLPTRPGLFPFLVALGHYAFGFHGRFVFVVNFVVGAATLVVVVALGRRLAGNAYGLLAAALLASFPLYALVVTSAGYDALNLLLFLSLLLGVAQLVAAPSALRFERLLIVTALAVQCRYESMLLVAALAVPALAQRRYLWREARFSPRLLLAPLLFFLPLVHRLQLAVAGTERGQPELMHTAPFSLAYVAPHLGRALAFFLRLDGRGFPTAPLTFVLATVGALLVIARLAAPPFRRRYGVLALYGAVSVVAIAAVHLSFAMGDLSTAHNARLATVYLGPMALLGAVPLHFALRRWNPTSGRRTLAVGAVAALLLALSLPVARRNQLMGALTLPREYAESLQRLAAFSPRRLVVVSDRPGMYVAQGWSAVSFGAFERRVPRFRADVELDRSDVVILQHVDRKSGAVTPRFLHAPSSVAIAEYPLDGDTDVRLSRVTFAGR